MKKIIALCVMGVFLAYSAESLAVKRYGENFCGDARFTCIKVKRGQSWEKLWPNSYQREVVKRLNRINMRLRPGMVIAVPKKLDQLTINDIAPFPDTIEPRNEKTIVVNPAALAWGAYDKDGRLIHWGPMSGGKVHCRDIGRGCRTKVGNFHVYHRDGAKCFSKKFPVGGGGAPMPYCMFFKGGYALHASKEVPGYHASHGCVRIFYNDAKWLNKHFIDLPSERRGTTGTNVIVNPYDV